MKISSLTEKIMRATEKFRRIRKKPLQKFQARKIEKGSSVIEMKGITKRFPGVLANDHIDLDIKAGEVHALLGENGAGKTTLMNILYGLLQPDEGEIRIYGRKVAIRSPKHAINLGIGMVHQYFMLIPTLTVAENIILGLKSSKEPFLDLDRAEKRIAELSERYALRVDPKAKIWQLSVGERQRVEIIKAIYRGAQVLILDEPTSVLTPLEMKELFLTLRRMVDEGYAVIPFITHKLPEVMALCDRVTVLRDGKVVSKTLTSQTSERDLAKKMVGREIVLRVSRRKVRMGKVVLEVKNLEALSDREISALKGISFSVHEGEILGIAGVAGNGQREMAEVITGLRKATGGQVLLYGQDIINKSPKQIIEAGVGHIPEDRLGRGLIMNFSVAENMILGLHGKSPFADRWFLPFDLRWFLNHAEVNAYAKKLISEYDIKTPSVNTPVLHLSGGNLQRLILARELSRKLKVLVAAQPTGGLDVGAAEYIREKLMEQKEKEGAILLISEDLDEIMSMSDRIAVMYEGRIMKTVPAEEAKVDDIGLMMTGATPK